jgi:hypothetical protein
MKVPTLSYFCHDRTVNISPFISIWGPIPPRGESWGLGGREEARSSGGPVARHPSSPSDLDSRPGEHAPVPPIQTAIGGGHGQSHALVARGVTRFGHHSPGYLLRSRPQSRAGTGPRRPWNHGPRSDSDKFLAMSGLG